MVRLLYTILEGVWWGMALPSWTAGEGGPVRNGDSGSKPHLTDPHPAQGCRFGLLQDLGATCPSCLHAVDLERTPSSIPPSQDPWICSMEAACWWFSSSCSFSETNHQPHHA